MKLLISTIILLSLVLAPASARGQNPNFSKELWQTTFNTDEKADGPKLPAPVAPWKPAMWTLGAINPASTAADVKALAQLCHDGGSCKKLMPPDMYWYLSHYERLDIFPNEKVPPNTLLICDFEGSEVSDYPAFICGNTLSITRKFVQYPGLPGDEGVNFGWTSQMREVDFFCLMRGFALSRQLGTNNNKTRSVMGDYVLMELYLGDPKLPNANQEAQFRAWSILLNATRVEFPRKKIIALVQGGYAYPGTGRISDAERQRVARFTLMFDGVWCWGCRQAAAPVLRDIAMLAADPLHTFDGEAWKRN